jgi:site-specific DNA recombinase
MTKSTTAAVYLRISQDPREDGLAVDRQESECLEIVSRRGWKLGRIYKDTVSASKKNVNRPEYNQMLLDFQRGKFSALICWDLDRLTRQPRQLEDWIEAAEDNGLILVTANGEADLTNDNGKLFARIKASVARAEIERKGARQRLKNAQLVADGKPVPGRRRWGYESDNMTIRESEASRIRLAFEDVRKGRSLRSIAIELGVRPVRLRETLTHRSYIGEVKHLGEFMPSDKIQPIVSQDLFDQVQAVLSDPTRKTSPGSAVKHLMSGIAKCGICNSGLVQINGYLCSAASNHVHIKKNYLDDYVIYSILNWLAQHKQPDESDATAEEVLPLVNELVELERRRSVQQELAEEVGTDLTKVKKRIKELAEEIDSLKRNIRGLRAKNAKSEALEEFRAQFWAKVDESGFAEWAEEMSQVEKLMGFPEKAHTLEEFITKSQTENSTNSWLEYWNSLELDQRREIVRAIFHVVVHKGRGLDRVELTPID